MPKTQKQNVNMSDLTITQMVNNMLDLEAELNKRRIKIDRLNEKKGKLLERVEELDKEIRLLGTSTSAGKKQQSGLGRAIVRKQKQTRKHPPGTVKAILDNTHPGVYSLGDVSQILKGAGVALTDQVIAMNLSKNGAFKKAMDGTNYVKSNPKVERIITRAKLPAAANGSPMVLA